jgi:hypothetical protein
MNAAGNTRASGICQMLSGQLNGPEEWVRSNPARLYVTFFRFYI